MSALPSTEQVLTAFREAVGGDQALARVWSVAAVAECSTPRGECQVEIYSAHGGRLLFKQSWPERPPFIAVVNGEHAWTRDPVSSKSIPMHQPALARLRGHEFHMIAIELEQRFHDLSIQGKARFAGQDCIILSAADDLGQPAKLYFRSDTHLLAGLELADPGERVRIVINAWREEELVLLPAIVTVTDQSGEFIYSFHDITLNSVDEEFFRVPAEVLG